jgi:protein-disulfide isomerase
MTSVLRGKGLFVLFGVIVVAIVAAVAIQLSRTESGSEGPTPAGLTETSGVLVGDEDAPVTVDVYADMQCPACRLFEATTGPTMAQLVESGDINVRYHVIAFLDRASTNEYSTRAASAVYCAASSEQFHDYLVLLYAQQPPEGGPGHENDALVQIGEQAGVTGDDFADCVEDERYAGFAARVTEAANKAGVSSTPTVMVDGEVLEDRSPAGLQAAVETAQ